MENIWLNEPEGQEQNILGTGMYIIDKAYNIICFNDDAKKVYPSLEMNKKCYEVIANRKTICEHCPLFIRNSTFYDTVRKEWISANSADVELPGYGDCHSIHFQAYGRTNTDNNLRNRDVLSEILISNIPGGYHRCYDEPGYPFQYISESFEDVVGWTKEEIETIYDNKYINLVIPEDIPAFEGLVDEIDQRKQGNRIYRIYKKGGGYRWVQDSTRLIEYGKNSFFQCTVVDITNHMEKLNEQKEALQEAMYRAESSNRAKSTFLFNASHDIRTPMNAIIGFADIIANNYDDKEQVKNMIGKIQKSSDTLLKLLNDVLEISRIESGKDEVDLSIISLQELSDKLSLMFSQELQELGITFSVSNDIQNPYVWCDELKITRIMMNLLSNAKKFTPNGGNVSLGIQEVPIKKGLSSYRFLVKDTGIGMSKEFQEKAFEQFERERSSTDSGVDGSGLGLAIIKKLVDLMGGTCNLESELGKGTTIYVDLQLETSKQKSYEPKMAVTKIADLSGKNVLLVEDNEFNREIACYVLEGAGLNITTAEDGIQAVSKVANAAPGEFDLILMDIQMPNMDGYTATQEIRRLSNKDLANIPIVAMTANAFAEDKAKCMEVGMNGHMSKPIDVSKLVEILTDLL